MMTFPIIGRIWDGSGNCGAFLRSRFYLWKLSKLTSCDNKWKRFQKGFVPTFVWKSRKEKFQREQFHAQLNLISWSVYFPSFDFRMTNKTGATHIIKHSSHTFFLWCVSYQLNHFLINCWSYIKEKETRLFIQLLSLEYGIIKHVLMNNHSWHFYNAGRGRRTADSFSLDIQKAKPLPYTIFFFFLLPLNQLPLNMSSWLKNHSSMWRSKCQMKTNILMPFSELGNWDDSIGLAAACLLQMTTAHSLEGSQGGQTHTLCNNWGAVVTILKWCVPYSASHFSI